MVNLMEGCFDLLFDLLSSGSDFIWLCFFSVVIAFCFNLVFFFIHRKV